MFLRGLPFMWPAGLMVKASVSGSLRSCGLAEDSGFDSQVGRFFASVLDRDVESR